MVSLPRSGRAWWRSPRSWRRCATAAQARRRGRQLFGCEGGASRLVVAAAAVVDRIVEPDRRLDRLRVGEIGPVLVERAPAAPRYGRRRDSAGRAGGRAPTVPSSAPRRSRVRLPSRCLNPDEPIPFEGALRKIEFNSAIFWSIGTANAADRQGEHSDEQAERGAQHERATGRSDLDRRPRRSNGSRRARSAARRPSSMRRSSTRKAWKTPSSIAWPSGWRIRISAPTSSARASTRC